MKGWVVQRFLRAFNFFLFGILVLVAVHMIREWIVVPPTGEPFPEVTIEKEVITPSLPMDSRKFVFKEPILGVSPSIHRVDLPIRFKGMASTGEKFFAAVEYQGKQSLVKEGQVLGDWVVKGISESEITLEDGRGQSFHIPISRGVRSATPPPAVKKLDENRMELDEQSLQNILSHWADLLREVKMLPYVEQGQSKGYVLLNVRPDGFVQKLGFRTGDIVERINGREVTNLESLLALYDHLEGGELKIDVRRGPKEIQLVYQVEKTKSS